MLFNSANAEINVNITTKLIRGLMQKLALKKARRSELLLRLFSGKLRLLTSARDVFAATGITLNYFANLYE